jgi:hypothetical protein
MKPRVLMLIPALLSAAVVLEPAQAADPIPTFSGCGKFAKDGPNDATDPVADPVPPEVEIEAAWVDAGGAKPTVNLQIADLTGSVPPPATSITYDATYSFSPDTTNFVRAFVDFSGSVVYEYGHTEPLGPNNTRYAYDGDIEGTMFPGQHGVVQMALPPEAGGKSGSVLKTMVGETQLGRTTFVPGAVNQSPSRGLSFQDDNVSIGTVTIGSCPGGTTGGGGSTGTTAPAPTTPAPTPATGGGSSQAAPLPVTLATKKLKRAKAKKRVAVKLKSSEALTSVDVRLSRGTTVFGTGKLAKLNGTGSVKFKLKKALKKGSYAFDVAGTDAKGARRIASFKLAVK